MSMFMECSRCRLISNTLGIILFVGAVYLSHYIVKHYYHHHYCFPLLIIEWMAVIFLESMIIIGVYQDYESEIERSEEEEKKRKEICNQRAREAYLANQLASRKRPPPPPAPRTPRTATLPPSPRATATAALLLKEEQVQATASGLPPPPPLESADEKQSNTSSSQPPLPRATATATATLVTKEEQVVVQVAADNGLPPLKTFIPDKCVICMQEFKDGDVIQPFGICLHEFHSSCLQSWLNLPKTTCPSCRQHLLSKGT